MSDGSEIDAVSFGCKRPYLPCQDWRCPIKCAPRAGAWARLFAQLASPKPSLKLPDPAPVYCRCWYFSGGPKSMDLLHCSSINKRNPTGDVSKEGSVFLAAHLIIRKSNGRWMIWGVGWSRSCSAQTFSSSFDFTFVLLLLCSLSQCSDWNFKKINVTEEKAVICNELIAPGWYYGMWCASEWQGQVNADKDPRGCRLLLPQTRSQFASGFKSGAACAKSSQWYTSLAPPTPCHSRRLTAARARQRGGGRGSFRMPGRHPANQSRAGPRPAPFSLLWRHRRSRGKESGGPTMHLETCPCLPPSLTQQATATKLHACDAQQQNNAHFHPQFHIVHVAICPFFKLIVRRNLLNI